MIFFRYMILFISAALLFRSDRVIVLLLIDFTSFLCSSCLFPVAVVAWNPVHTFSSLLYCALGELAAVSVSCRASGPYLFNIYGISSQQSQITLL